MKIDVGGSDRKRHDNTYLTDVGKYLSTPMEKGTLDSGQVKIQELIKGSRQDITVDRLVKEGVKN